MSYAVLSCINGTFKVETEHGDNLQGGKMSWHDKCRIYENASDVKDGTVVLVNEQFATAEGFLEHITHPVDQSEG